MFRSSTSRSTITAGVSRSWTERMAREYRPALRPRPRLASLRTTHGVRRGDRDARSRPPARGAPVSGAGSGAGRRRARDARQRGLWHGRAPSPRAAGGRAVPPSSPGT
jgi:hypothetical protein